MIPKIIHFCWLSGDEYPESIKVCIDSWQQVLPDYEIRLWDTKRFDVNKTQWTKQAFETGKYAFAADYIRLYALYTEGGIYLDSDVMMYKSFDDLLCLPYFIGEDNVHCFEPAIIGAEAGTPWLKDVLNRYNGLAFINSDGSYNMRGLPVVFHEQLTPKYKFTKVSGIDKFCYDNNIITIFPREFFNSRDYVGSIRTPQSYCSHHYVGSWLKVSPKKWDWLKKMLPRQLVNLGYHLRYCLIDHKTVERIQIPLL